MPFDIHPKLPAWQQSLKVGDIVAFRYPPASGAMPSVNPALVVEVVSIAGDRVATLVCGAPARGRTRHGAIVLETPHDLAEAGLTAPTRFLTAKRLTVSLSNDGFVVHPGTGSPIVGRLSPGLLPGLEEARGRMWGEAAMRGSRRPVRRRPRVRGVDFEVVERRRYSETPRRRALRASQ